MRTGDTTAAERRSFGKTPPDVLVTTPESLFLILTSSARESLRGVETVIVDEVHAVAGGKRGAHLALSLERLDSLLPKPAQRIGLSATVRPVDEVERVPGRRPAGAGGAAELAKTIEVRGRGAGRGHGQPRRAPRRPGAEPARRLESLTEAFPPGDIAPGGLGTLEEMAGTRCSGRRSGRRSRSGC